MNLIKSLMGRRQFLMAAGLVSTCALTCKKLAGFQTRAAMAAERAAAASIKAAGNKCPHLLSPLKIRDRVLKNRIMHTVAPVFTLQGPENYPTDAWRNLYSDMAKNAAIVTTNTCFGKFPKKYHTKEENPAYWSWEHISNNKWEDIPPVWNYVERMIEDIHCEGSLILNDGNSGYTDDPVPGESSGLSGTLNLQSGNSDAAAMFPPESQAPKSIEEIVKEAKEAMEKGYDVFQISADSLDAVQAVRSSTNLILMASHRVGMVMGMGDGRKSIEVTGMIQPTASELEQVIEQARTFEGLADFVLIRSSSGPWALKKDQLPSTVYYAEAIKKAGLKILTCINGGLHDPIQNNALIAGGKTDMVGMTRPFFADADLVKKVAAGMVDDIIPCTQCQNCHAISMTKGPHYAQCTVNPTWATPPYKLASIKEPLIKKKVAVIGGGPAGMKAAITAAERGHKVTLYEKDAALGGLQKHLDYTQWNWGYRLFKDWLIHQVNKAGIDVNLNTTATPAMIKSKGYDTVLVATGAEPVISRMPGADSSNVFNILTCYSNRSALGKNVVMIGAGKIGTEAAICMVKDGHKVTVLAPGEELIDPKDVGPHNAGPQERIYKNHPDFKYVMKTTVKGIAGGKVNYTDSKGADRSIQADSIVIWSGLKPRTDDAEKFSGSADEVLLLGDCKGETDRLIKTMRSAFFVASQV